MDLYFIDHLAVTGRSWLHRLPAWVKLLALAGIIGVALATWWAPVHAGILAAALLLAISARLPLRTVLTLALYPIIFLAIIFLSMRGLTLEIGLTLTLRVLAITASVIVVLLTTSYPAIFGALGRVLPGALVAALFFTYRSLFIFAVSLANVRTALHLKGGLEWRRPFASLKNLGLALGHVFVHAIETSQRMADSLTIRGFRNRMYYLGGK